MDPWPSGMVKFIGMGLLICKCKRLSLITDGSITRLTLTLAPMGMVAPWRCQEQQTFGRADQCLIHWAMESKTQTEMHDWKLMTWRHKLTLTQLKTDSILKHNRQTGKDAQSRAYSIQPTLIVLYTTRSTVMEQPMQPCKHAAGCLISSHMLTDEQRETTTDRKLPWKLLTKWTADKLAKHKSTGWLQEYCEWIFINIALVQIISIPWS